MRKSKTSPEEDPRLVLGRRLRQARRRADATQWDVARRAGLTQSAIVKAEYGMPVTPDTLARIVAALRDLEAEAAKELRR
jgi:predicted transcriptional regulator